MFSQYFKTGFRNLLRNRTHFFVNITGLAIGFSAFLLIFLVLAFEQRFDNFHPGKDRIYRVVREKSKNPTDRDYRTGVPFPVTNALRADLPQLETAAAITADYGVQVTIPGPNGNTQKKFKENKGVFFAEPGFFQIFRFPLLQGDITNAIREPNTALLTKQLATKYFGDWRIAMGKVVRAYGEDMRITGILDNPPANTDFPLGMVISYNTMDINMNDWHSILDENYCFVRLQPGQTPARVETLLLDFMTRHLGPNADVGYNLRLQPLREMHFDKRLGNFNGRTFSHDLITALSLVGIFLLVIACVNFINLSTASAVNRAREIGVRKVLGGPVSSIIVLLSREFTLLITLAFLVATPVAWYFMQEWLQQYTFRIHLGAGFFLATLLSSVLIAWLTVGHSAIKAATANPVKSLRTE